MLLNCIATNFMVPTYVNSNKNEYYNGRTSKVECSLHFEVALKIQFLHVYVHLHIPCTL